MVKSHVSLGLVLLVQDPLVSKPCRFFAFPKHVQYERISDSHRLTFFSAVCGHIPIVTSAVGGEKSSDIETFQVQ